MLSNNKKLIAVIGATGQKFAGSFLGQPKSPRCPVTGKRTPTWVRIRPIKLCSRAKLPADNRPRARRGHWRISTCRRLKSTGASARQLDRDTQ